jgi:hypothetical protein
MLELYTNELPNTQSRQFIYADDTCWGTRSWSFEDLDLVLISDIALLTDYCKKWRLIHIVTKTVSSSFHLRNASSDRDVQSRELLATVNASLELLIAMELLHHPTQTSRRVIASGNLQWIGSYTFCMHFSTCIYKCIWTVCASFASVLFEFFSSFLLLLCCIMRKHSFDI